MVVQFRPRSECITGFHHRANFQNFRNLVLEVVGADFLELSAVLLHFLRSFPYVGWPLWLPPSLLINVRCSGGSFGSGSKAHGVYDTWFVALGGIIGLAAKSRHGICRRMRLDTIGDHEGTRRSLRLSLVCIPLSCVFCFFSFFAVFLPCDARQGALRTGF